MNREEYAKVFEEDTNSEIISRTLTICNIYSHEVNRSTSPSFRQWPSTIRVLSRCLNAAVTPHTYDTYVLTSGSWFSILLEEPDHLKYQIRECYTLRIANTKANSEFRQTYKPTVQRWWFLLCLQTMLCTWCLGANTSLVLCTVSSLPYWW